MDDCYRTQDGIRNIIIKEKNGVVFIVEKKWYFCLNLCMDGEDI